MRAQGTRVALSACMHIRHVLVAFMVMVAGCSASDGTRSLPSQLANDPCGAHDQQSCTGGCEWIAIGNEIGCTDVDTCLVGVCVTPDPCRTNGDEMSCYAAGCAWAGGIAGLCPAGADCSNGGFCYTPSDDSCVCACPAICPAGEECPPCQCDCTGGGTTCTCETPVCGPGEMCPPSTCDCGGSSCSDAETCTCMCPLCPVGQMCPPCDCACNGGSAPTTPSDACSMHDDATSCDADTANECTWTSLGIPCMEGQMCNTGVCQHIDPGGGGGTGCGCACPACPAGEMCPPCDCGPMSGGGSGGGGGTTPTP